MPQSLYSIRMHATREGRHLSGAERLAPRSAVEALAAALVRRALEHPRGQADRLRLTVEAVPAETVRFAQLPDLRTVPVADYFVGRQAALRLLERAGVAPEAAAIAMQALAAGAAPEGVAMRGAMLVDAQTGARLEADPARGIRVSRMDLAASTETELGQGLRPLGLDNPHVREALLLAGKVLAAPAIVAELCWSDDPDYTAGYVAAPHLGYVRLPHLKPAGEERGGRAFFLRGGREELPALIDFLEKQPVLFDRLGALRGETLLEE
ncbi:MAG: 6-carboxyhexanoate--CoA ligase [Desulfuromonadales bacterium]|nr:6-carboxyhexanoate--CoA ligase [Desulfuromonadales bacterium]